MVDVAENEIMTDLIGEVRGYLPEMENCLLTLADDDSNDEIAGELHRMTHTIKGAASMVGLLDLGETAAVMEQALDEIIDGRRNLTPGMINAMSGTVKGISQYCDSVCRGEADEREGEKLYQEVVADFKEVTTEMTEEGGTEESAAPDLLFAGILAEGDEEDLDDIFNRLSGEEEKPADDEDDLESLFSSYDEVDDIEDDWDNLAELTELIDVDEPIAETEPFPELATDPEPTLEQTINPELLACFKEETDEHLENISIRLNGLTSTVSEEMIIDDSVREILHSIRRSVHTLKGAAAVIGIDSVAAWGHEFEDFLDWLHDDSAVLSPDIVDAMLDGADILEKIASNPDIEIKTEITGAGNLFRKFITTDTGTEPDTNKKTAPENTENQQDTDSESSTLPQECFQTAAELEETTAADDREISAIIGEPRPERRKQERQGVDTLRVDVSKIDKLIGLGGDMAINLSSFEDTMATMRSSILEFDGTLQRLKTITSNLEAGYELAAIPHLGGVTGSEEGGVTQEFDPLEMDRYSELNIMIRSLNEAVSDLDSIRDQNAGIRNSWRRTMERQQGVLDEVRNTMGQMRMTPFTSLANRLHRTTRESARATGKKVRLLIEGQSLQMDTRIWNTLADPLMHMLRNSVDHGIETNEERKQIGKPVQATIKIEAQRRGNQFVLRIADDGKGLDFSAIRKKATKLYSTMDVAGMSDNQLAGLIFRQGFSLSSKVTTMSGRGVGMDVVRHGVEQLNGTIEVKSTSGMGVTFIIRLPVSVAQFPAYFVRFGGQRFMVPMRDIFKVMRVGAAAINKDEFELDGELLPLIRPAEIMRLKNGPGKPASSVTGEEKPIVLLVDTGSRRGAIPVDELLGQREVVFKDLGTHLLNVPYISGVTIMGDGGLVPILNTDDLLNREKGVLHRVGTEVVQSRVEVQERVLSILIADDSISIRKVLANFISGQGWQPIVATDGVDAMEKIRDNEPDLIILDIEMPRMNGFEVLQSLQAQPAYREIPTLMLTSRSADKYRKKARELGARGFVNKPFKDEELIALINELA